MAGCFREPDPPGAGHVGLPDRHTHAADILEVTERKLREERMWRIIKAG
jgi:hypothetical protein